MSGDGDEDPVERLEDSAGDREGDPFEVLSDPEADEGAGRETDPWEQGPEGDRPIPDPLGEETEPDDREVADPRVGPDEAGPARPGDPFDDAESVFQEMDVGDVDIDAVWEELADAESVAGAGERTYAEVSKHSFCEDCEYFSGPPEISCSHEGTEIVEFVDMETVRVVDCPIVAERRELERES